MTGVSMGVAELLTGARVWGAELEPSWRVLAVTVEPPRERHPEPDAPDPRLQLLLHPCAQLRVVLTRADGTIERFALPQLPVVVDRLDGPVLHGPGLGAATSRPTGPASLEGASSAPDGRRNVFDATLRGDDRELRIWATYDHAELRRPDGSLLADLP